MSKIPTKQRCDRCKRWRTGWWWWPEGMGWICFDCYRAVVHGQEQS